MKAKIVGTKHSAIKDEKTGETQHYYKLNLLHKNPFDNDFTKYTGMGVTILSVPKSVFDQAVLDGECLLDFDGNKKLLDFEMI